MSAEQPRFTEPIVPPEAVLQIATEAFSKFPRRNGFRDEEPVDPEQLACVFVENTYRPLYVIGPENELLSTPPRIQIISKGVCRIILGLKHGSNAVFFNYHSYLGEYPSPVPYEYAASCGQVEETYFTNPWFSNEDGTGSSALGFIAQVDNATNAFDSMTRSNRRSFVGAPTKPLYTVAFAGLSGRIHSQLRSFHGFVVVDNGIQNAANANLNRALS